MPDPMRAILYIDRAALQRDALPGSVLFTDPAEDGVSALWFICPSGSGLLQRITVGVGFKPVMQGASWRWDGNANNPTLHPSVNVQPSELSPGWHGWLRGGYWETS